jgi:hypothetical protein
VTSATLAQLLPERLEGLAGFVYFAIGPLRAFIGSYFGKRAKIAFEKSAKNNPGLTKSATGKSRGSK